MSYTIAIRNNATGEVRFKGYEYEWDDGQLFYLTEGNMSCDSNRELVWRVAGGESGSLISDLLDDDNHVCNEGHFSITEVRLPDGTVIPIEDPDEILDRPTSQHKDLPPNAIDQSQSLEVISPSKPLKDTYSELCPVDKVAEVVTSPAQPTIYFQRYKEDGTIRLFKEHSITGEVPAGYADKIVVVKARVKTSGDDFVVILTIKREQLNRPDVESWLAALALEWAHGESRTATLTPMKGLKSNANG